MHTHTSTPHVKAIYATDIPGKDAGQRTQAVSFYNQDGSLALAVYAQIAGEKPDPAALEGFKKTAAKIRRCRAFACLNPDLLITCPGGES